MPQQVDIPKEVREQLWNPQHCYILNKKGKYLCHSSDYYTDTGRLVWKRGDKIRFTRLAAERTAEALGLTFHHIEPIIILLGQEI